MAQLTPCSQGTQEISFKLYSFETPWKLMGQWTNSNICRIVTDVPKGSANMSKFMFDRKKKNPYWLIHSLRASICVCKYLQMLSATFHYWVGGADDPDLSVDLTRSAATFRTPEILYIIHRNCYTSQGDPDSSFPLWCRLGM